MKTLKYLFVCLLACFVFAGIAAATEYHYTDYYWAELTEEVFEAYVDDLPGLPNPTTYPVVREVGVLKGYPNPDKINTYEQHCWIYYPPGDWNGRVMLSGTHPHWVNSFVNEKLYDDHDWEILVSGVSHRKYTDIEGEEWESRYDGIAALEKGYVVAVIEMQWDAFEELPKGQPWNLLFYGPRSRKWRTDRSFVWVKDFAGFVKHRLNDKYGYAPVKTYFKGHSATADLVKAYAQGKHPNIIRQHDERDDDSDGLKLAGLYLFDGGLILDACNAGPNESFPNSVNSTVGSEIHFPLIEFTSENYELYYKDKLITDQWFADPSKYRWYFVKRGYHLPGGFEFDMQVYEDRYGYPAGQFIFPPYLYLLENGLKMLDDWVSNDIEPPASSPRAMQNYAGPVGKDLEIPEVAVPWFGEIQLSPYARFPLFIPWSDADRMTEYEAGDIDEAKVNYLKDLKAHLGLDPGSDSFFAKFITDDQAEAFYKYAEDEWPSWFNPKTHYPWSDDPCDEYAYPNWYYDYLGIPIPPICP